MQLHISPYSKLSKLSFLFNPAKTHDLHEILDVIGKRSSMDINRKKKLDNAVSLMIKDCAKQIILVIVLLLVMYSNQDSQLYHQNNSLRNIFLKHKVHVDFSTIRFNTMELLIIF